LSLKSDEETILTAHTTCILDSTFFEKHAKEGTAEKEFKRRKKELLYEEKSLAQTKKEIDKDEEKKGGKNKDGRKLNADKKNKDSSTGDTPDEEEKDSVSYLNSSSEESSLHLDMEGEESSEEYYEGGITGKINRYKEALKDKAEEYGVSEKIHDFK